MEGFLNLRMVPWLRRLMTRTMAIIPAVLTILIAGEKATLNLIILSQVVLSMQLPFAVIPLIRFTGDRARMGEFANRAWVKALAWTTAAVILALNFWLAWDVSGEWISASPWRVAVIAPLVIALLGCWASISFSTLRTPQEHTPASPIARNLREPVYRRILVPLDHTDRDRSAISHAAAMARLHGATLHLVHVEEGAISQLYGALSSTAEIQAGDSISKGSCNRSPTRGFTPSSTSFTAAAPRTRSCAWLAKFIPIWW